MLSHIQDGKEIEIAYGSKTLSRSQRILYHLSGVVGGCDICKAVETLLICQPFLLRTDHASLIWLKNFKEPERLLVRWISLLETYDFTIEHSKGSHHGNAYGLSRRPRKRCKRENCCQCDGAECSANALTESTQPLTNSNTQSESNWVEQCRTESLQN